MFRLGGAILIYKYKGVYALQNLGSIMHYTTYINVLGLYPFVLATP